MKKVTVILLLFINSARGSLSRPSGWSAEPTSTGTQVALDAGRTLQTRAPGQGRSLVQVDRFVFKAGLGPAKRRLPQEDEKPMVPFGGPTKYSSKPGDKKPLEAWGGPRTHASHVFIKEPLEVWGGSHSATARGALGAADLPDLHVDAARRPECYAGTLSEAEAPECVQESPLQFLHIPKTAGTTIEDSGLKEGVRWGRHMDFDRCGMGSGGACNAPWHEPPALMSSVNVYTNATVFCVVRNPFARAVSEYRYINVYPEFRWGGADVVERYGCGPEGLNEWLVRVLSKYLGGARWLQLCHMVPQSYYIWGVVGNSNRRCEYCHEVLHLEEFPEAFDSLMARYNMTVKLAPEKENEGACHNLTAKDINSTTADLIRRVYLLDFELLGYSTDPSQAHSKR